MLSADTWNPGDTVWLRMGDATYPAVITEVCDYTDTHDDGYECQQYHAQVVFPNGETVEDGLVSHCMITARTGEGQGA